MPRRLNEAAGAADASRVWARGNEPRIYANARESEIVDDPAPFHFWPAEIDQQREVESGGLQIVDTLRQVLIGKILHAFDLYQQAIFDHQVRGIRADVPALVRDREGSLGLHPKTAQTEFFDERPFVDLSRNPAPRTLLTS